ncbi:MAG: ribosome recycling factor [Defluviitaleaceae bacterium]|nr:ribosome recycling factor [Defluviitaleaceae bacterium]
MSEIKQFEEKMKKTVILLENEFKTIRAGRANPAILDKITVDYYGTPTPLNQIGNITVPEARIIQIAPWEKAMLKEVEKAIQASDLGLNPNSDGTVIRLVFPELTEERRKDLTKETKKKGEDAKVGIRNVRREAIDAFKRQEKNNELTEDDLKSLEDDIQKATDKFVAEIDRVVEVKNKDILSI